MNFKLIINRSSIFYFFLQNLAMWHFSNRDTYSIEWRKELPQFSKEEENALLELKIIHQKYTFGPNYLGDFFFSEKDPWKAMLGVVSEDEIKKLKHVFEVFHEKFSLFFGKEEPLLGSWKSLLSKRLENKEEIAKIGADMGVLYNIPVPNENVAIFLLPSLEKRLGGTVRSMREKIISVEVSRQDNSQGNHVVGIVWHETGHLLFEQQKLIPLIAKKYLEPGSPSLIKEILISSLFPAGCLAEKYFSFERTGQIHARLSKEEGKEILKLVNPYILEQKPFDEKLIDDIFRQFSHLKGVVR